MKQIVLLASLLAAVIISKAQAPSEKTLLWEISGNGLTQSSYLFGTLHLMCPSELKMPATVQQKFATTKQLFLEIDMDDPNMMMEMMQGMQMHNDTTLKQLLKNDYDSISSIFLSKTGMPLKMLNTTKPFLLLSMIYPSLLGCQPISWEGEFVKMAKEKNMEVKGLELIADQIKIFEQIPYNVQASMFIKTLYNLDSSRLVFDDMVKVYKEKDIKKMHDMTTSDSDLGEYENELLNKRNHNWIPIIGMQAKKMPTFFAFGAGHLAGEQGVINLLRKNGFTVTPVHYKN